MYALVTPLTTAWVICSAALPSQHRNYWLRRRVTRRSCTAAAIAKIPANEHITSFSGTLSLKKTNVAKMATKTSSAMVRKTVELIKST